MLASLRDGCATLDASARTRCSPGRKPSTNKEAEVEETIGYQALIPSEEWDSLAFVEWDEATIVEIAR